ncbi:udp-N-acetylglucosamine 4-epimerase [Salmonella bongori]|nr:udp-N-acetylglucosamine 4-epimerase [Salmonella bongori]
MLKNSVATTQFDATKVHSSGFTAPYTLSQGLDRTLQYEFVHAKQDDITFVSE